MTPLVIGLPAVVAVIVLAVVIGLHLIKKNERARLGDPPPSKDRPAKAGRGQADDRNGGENEPWREPARPGVQPRSRRPLPFPLPRPFPRLASSGPREFPPRRWPGSFPGPGARRGGGGRGRAPAACPGAAGAGRAAPLPARRRPPRPHESNPTV